jgi:hypothetical protein
MEQSKAMFRIDPLAYKYYKQKGLEGQNEFRALIKGNNWELDLNWSQIVTKSIELFTLSSFQTFGVALPVQDENSIELYSGQILRQQGDLLTTPCNYSAITTVGTEFFKVELAVLLQILKNKPLAEFKRSLTCMSHDSQYRQTLISNQAWAKVQKAYVTRIMEKQQRYQESIKIIASTA